MAHAAANPMSRGFIADTRADGLSSGRPSGNRFGLMNQPWANSWATKYGQKASGASSGGSVSHGASVSLASPPWMRDHMCDAVTRPEAPPRF